MDNKIVSILEYIAAAIEDGRISIYIDSDKEAYKEDPVAASMLPMLAANLSEYIKEEHNKLNRELVQPLAICENGDVLIRTTDKGLEYYKDNKEQLYTDLYLKCGATRVYVYAYDLDECWVQHEKSSIVKDLGQIPDFGTQRPMNEPEATNEDYKLDASAEEMLNTPLLTISELSENLPEALAGIKLHVTDIGQIMQIIQNRLTAITFENIENLMYERHDQHNQERED